MFRFWEPCITTYPLILFLSIKWRTRIHALNILRLIILDAPLASEMRAFVGDCLISALVGYSDSSWAVRNSSTMTFAAVMLRVVDADKNAGGKVKGRKMEVRRKISLFDKDFNILQLSNNTISGWKERNYSDRNFPQLPTFGISAALFDTRGD